MPPENETNARILIDALLKSAGWAPADKTQVRTEVFVEPRVLSQESLVVQEEAPAVSQILHSGRCDYVLLDTNGRPIAIIEAKHGRIDPYTARQQALPYARTSCMLFLRAASSPRFSTNRFAEEELAAVIASANGSLLFTTSSAITNILK
jgi:type I site-specific restriction endonuclease